MDHAVWRIRNLDLDLDQGVLVGILNVTPDSFSDGGDFLSQGGAVAGGRNMHSRGAQVVDVGGESTRPGAAPVDLEVEMRRVLPVVGTLVGSGIPVSVDTSKPEVARASIEAGASIVNDVRGFENPAMVEAVVGTGVGVVVVHMPGDPRTMQDRPFYDDVVDQVGEYLVGRAGGLVDAGLDPASIAIDPGFGFGKTPTHNLELISRVGELVGHGYPVMLGSSRKSTLGLVSGQSDPKERDSLTAVTTAMAFERGARLFRVHDVVSSRDALRIAAAIVEPQRWAEWQQD